MCRCRCSTRTRCWSGWARVTGVPGLDGVAAQVLRVAVPSRRAPLRRDLRQLRRQAAVVHPRHAGAPRRRRQPAAGGVRQRGRTRATSTGSRAGSARIVVDGFGSTEGGVAIGRTPDTPPGALGPLPDGHRDRRRRDRRTVPARSHRRAGEHRGPGQFRGLLQRSRRRRRADARRRLPQRRPRPTATRTATRTSPGGSATGCASTARTSAPRRSSGC